MKSKLVLGLLVSSISIFALADENSEVKAVLESTEIMQMNGNGIDRPGSLPVNFEFNGKPFDGACVRISHIKYDFDMWLKMAVPETDTYHTAVSNLSKDLIIDNDLSTAKVTLTNESKYCMNVDSQGSPAKSAQLGSCLGFIREINIKINSSIIESILINGKAATRCEVDNQ